MAPHWARDGSFVVLRRLRQDVPAFNRFLARTAAELRSRGGDWLDTTEARVAALIVGRWQSGTPLMRAPSRDDPTLGATDGVNNAFSYRHHDDPGDGFPASPPDVDGRLCPIGAHVRKVNPRDANTDLGIAARTLRRRVLRRGIPYGPPVAPGQTQEPVPTDRGLLFVSYQASIKDQFEFLSRQWLNAADRPENPRLTGGKGIDLLVGQTQGDRHRTLVVRDADGADAPIDTQYSAPAEWVVATGGGYFFAPSLSALRDVLGAG